MQNINELKLIYTCFEYKKMKTYFYKNNQPK